MTSLFAAFLLLACKSTPIHDDYAAARAEALVSPGAAPTNWKPDAVLWLAGETVDEFVALALKDQEALSAETEVKAGPTSGKVRPEIKLDRLKLRSTDQCSSCLAADATLSGDLHYAIGPAKGSVPVTVKAVLDLRFVAEALGNGAFNTRLEPQGVRSLELDFGKRGLPNGVDRRVENALQERLAANLDIIELGVLGEGAPLRAVRLEPSPHGLGIAMLTASPTLAALPWAAPKIRTGWEADLHSQAALGLARKASFEAGPMDGEIVVEPRDLMMEGRNFELTLRMWRLAGNGWWRDVTVKGQFEVNTTGLSLNPSSVVQTAASEGAAGSDPLAWIGEDMILSAVQDALSTTMPRSRQISSEGWVTHLAVSNVSGVQDRLTLRGTVDVVHTSPSTPAPTSAKMKPFKGKPLERKSKR